MNASLLPDSKKRLIRAYETDDNPEAQFIELELCRRSVKHFFNNWVWTFDPRRTAAGLDAFLPMALWPRQAELLDFFDARVLAREDGLVEKSRDSGFTWLAGGYALHKWLFLEGFKSAFGSRKEEYVDRKGEPDSIFEKIRMIFRLLPPWMKPSGFGDQHDNYMRLINPANTNTIRGEGGADIGRGGRSTILILDEAAHLEHGDQVEAATSATADCRIWASSVMGMGNVFARKRHGGSLRPDQIFIFDVADNPLHTPAWIAKKKASLEAHVWAAEYGRDYSASVEGICILSMWVDASLELTKMWKAGKLKAEPLLRGCAGLDVGAGKARSVFIARFGPIVLLPVAWGDPDTIETAHRALDCAAAINLRRKDGHDCKVATLNYDSIGVGVGVQAAFRSHDKLGLSVFPVNVGATPSADTIWEDQLTSEQKFVNLKAEGWWKTRARFKCAFELWQHLTGAKDTNGKKLGHNHPVSDCILLPLLTDGPDAQILAAQISMPKWFRNEKGKIIMESKQQMAVRELPSPDHADALVLTECTTSALAEWERLGAS